ncbi:MAG: DUF4131 domain-containing protein, partial [Desulfovibrio sp.]|nr:DUF4131 domain-containing protein [Desulfovibrio sp.]
MRYPPLQSPLLWQTYLAFWIMGILAAPWPVPAAICAVLIIGVDDRLWHCQRLFFALFCFVAALLTAQWQLYGAPGRTSFPDMADINAQQRLCAVVRDTQGLPDNRLRILLANASVQQASPSKPLPGLIQWTWDTPTADAPLPGQSVCLARRLLPVGGFAN